MFLRLSLVRLCLLSDRMFLYILKDLSTSTLAVWQNLNLATSSKPMALWPSGNVLPVPESTPAIALTWPNPGFFSMTLSSLDLSCWPTSPGMLASLFYASSISSRAAVSCMPCSSSLVMKGDRRTRCALIKGRSALTVWLVTKALLSLMALASCSSNCSRTLLNGLSLSGLPSFWTLYHNGDAKNGSKHAKMAIWYQKTNKNLGFMSKMLFWKPEYVNMLFCLKYVKKYAFMLSHFFPVSSDNFQTMTF